MRDQALRSENRGTSKHSTGKHGAKAVLAAHVASAVGIWLQAIFVIPMDPVARHVQHGVKCGAECGIKNNPDYGADYDAKRTHRHIGCFFINASPVG